MGIHICVLLAINDYLVIILFMIIKGSYPIEKSSKIIVKESLFKLIKNKTLVLFMKFQ